MNANTFSTMSELQITNSALRDGWVKFSYYKADGTKRVAIGTRNLALISKAVGRNIEPKTAERYFSNCHGYFDLVRGAWRQFNESRFIGLELDRLSDTQAVAAVAAIVIGWGEDCNEAMLVCSNLIGIPLTSSVFNYAESTYDSCYFDDGLEKCDYIYEKVSHNIIGFHEKFAPKQGKSREELIAELKELRKREDEILAELLK